MTAEIGRPGTLMSANAWMPRWRGPRGAVPALLLALVTVGVREAAGAIIPVTNLEQKISSTGGCSLQEAIYSANFDNNVAIAGYSGSTPVEVTTQCVPGNGDDTIVLPAGAVLRLSQIVDDHINPTGPTATPIITSNITILAYGATLQRTGIRVFRLFAVGSTGHLTIRRALIKDFWARGGDGGRGGGGGMGAGGAIYVVDGVLVVEASTFAGNAATGGKGGVGLSGSGGGGGLGGNGGLPCFFSALRGGTGGGGARGNGAPCFSSTGGGGGGTVSSGSRTGGFACGGNGGDASETDPLFSGTGQGGQCAGGGGGGGGEHFSGIIGNDGGNGAYGGGGGGGAESGGGYGGRGGFGGGGGASGSGGLFTGGKNGGNGGFGGGGGGGAAGAITDGDGGNGGFFGGDGGDSGGGGGGAGLGGAIFNDSGTVDVRNSTFAGNSTQGGFSEEATDGVTGGGAIFSRNGHLSVLNTTISGGLAHIGGGILVVQDSEGAPTSFDLQNSIIANNGDKECAISGFSIAASFVGNLIESNADGSGFKGRTFIGCPGVVTSDDPQLGPLQYNDGATPTMAISSTSPARDAADPAASLPVDQRRQERPAMGGFDIGAFELCLEGSGKLQMPCPIIFGPESGQEVQLTIDVAPPGGGTTLPAPGVRQVATDSVVALSATPSPGFRFTEWSLNVTNPGQPSTTVFMDMPQIVIANFAACSCATDVSGSISVARGPFVLNPVTRRYAQTVTLTNTSAAVIAAPISLVLDNLTSTATLYNATGVTQDMLPAGRPYINANISLGPGQSGSITLQFTGASTSAISYDTRVLAGPGSR